MCRVASPREGAGWTLVAAPDTASDGLVAEEKEQLRPDTQITFLPPIDFLIFWHFLVVPIPFLVYPPVSQKTEMSEQWRQRYLLAVTKRFSQRWLSAYHKECRELVRWNIISFFSWNRDNHILISLPSLNWPKHTERKGKIHCIHSIISYISCICWEEKEGGRKGRGRETMNPFEDVLAYFRLQHPPDVHSPDGMFLSESPPQCKNRIIIIKYQ